MKIKEASVVSVVYELYIADPDTDYEIVEVVGEDEPMVFLFGHSGLPVDFENRLLDMSVGDDFDFELEPQEGFGLFSKDDISDFEISFFKIDDGQIPEGLLDIGNFVPFTDAEGDRITGKVLAVSDTLVSIDFNHPLAGKKLRFEGEILSIREATAIELEHGHVHGPGGVQH